MSADADAPVTRQFIVVTCEENRRGELRRVQATTHEEAVSLTVAAETLSEAGVVYEVWPALDPGAVLRVTLRPPRVGRPVA